MKKLISLLVILCVLHVLAGAGLAAYLFGTGRLDGPKIRVIADLARHQGTPDKLREKVGEILETTPVSATASAPASQKAGAAPADAGADRSLASAQERINFARQLVEQERLAMENQKQELLDMHKSLEMMTAELANDRQKFEIEKKSFEPKVAAADQHAKAENFSKMLALFDELKTKQVKDLFVVDNQPDLAAAYLTAMDPARAAKIIGEFKSPPESKFIEDVLNRIRTNGTTSASAPAAPGNVAAAPRP